MKLSIIVSRFSNLLFFAQKSEVFNDELQKYLIDEHADMLFYGESKEKILKKFGKSASKQNIKYLEESISSITSDFSSHWGSSSKQLSLWRKYFQKNQSLLLQVISNIKKISGVKNFTLSNISIYLVAVLYSKDKEINAWFSWTPKETFIVVEIPFSLKTPKDFFPLGILAHEFFHLMLRKNKKLFLKIDEIAAKNKKVLLSKSDGMPCRMFLEELIVSSFIPEGYLSEKFFHIKSSPRIVKPKSLLDWRKFIAFSLRGLSKNYVDNTQVVDDRYIENLVKIIKTVK